MAVAVSYGKVDKTVIGELESIVGEENVFTLPHYRAARASVPAPFPLHKWSDHTPDVVVLPKSTEEVVEIVKLANKYKIPIVPRAGATGLADGAVPLRKGILLDIKRMSDIIEIDEVNRTVTVQPGINMQELNRVLEKMGLWFPDDPASYPVAVIGGRVGTGGWSLIGAFGGHIPELVLSMEVVLPTGDVIRVGNGGGKKIRKSSVGFRLKDLFIGHQGTLGITTEVTLDVFPRPEVEFPAFFGFRNFEHAHETAFRFTTSGLKTIAGVVIFDEEKVEYLRRDDEAYIPQPKTIKSIIATVMYGTEAEVEGAKKRLFEIAEKSKAIYLGEELSEGDWASRHDRYALPLHGRRWSDWQVVPMTWHCEDSAVLHSDLPYVRKRWHAIARKYIEKYDGVFDDWGMFMYSNPAFRPWGDYLTEIDIGINELELNEETWNAWVNMKREIAEVVLEVGGSISACHGGTRDGDVELCVKQELKDGQFELMKKIKRMLDPNNIMNPGKYMLDEAYLEG